MPVKKIKILILTQIISSNRFTILDNMRITGIRGQTVFPQNSNVEVPTPTTPK